MSTETGGMTVYAFGRELLRLNDLDPIYVLAWEAIKADALRDSHHRFKLKRWLLAYWCFYHVGTASALAYPHDVESAFFDRMMTAALSKGNADFPRSAERRHFRGRNAEASVKWLRSQGVDNLFSYFDSGPAKSTLGILRAEDIIRYVRTWVGFGPWIAFKVADMLERLDLCRVAFDTHTVMYDSPQEGARLHWSVCGEPSNGFGDAVGEWAINDILTHLASPPSNERPRTKVYSQRPLNVIPKMSRVEVDNREVDEFRGRLAGFAPPRYDRPLNGQEVETILCKWHSYTKGHYEIGEDVRAARNALLRFAKCPLSQELIKAGKRGGLWK